MAFVATLVLPLLVPHSSVLASPTTTHALARESPEPFSVQSTIVPSVPRRSRPSASPSPDPPPNLLVVTCRNNSCLNSEISLSCWDDNGRISPPRGRTILLAVRDGDLEVQYRATVWSILVDWNLLWFIPWRRATTNGPSGAVRCAQFAFFGTPFGFSPRTGRCCNACSIVRGRRRPPGFLCCGSC